MPPEQLELDLSAPVLVTEAGDSEVGRATSVRKLNGQFYTPLAVARRLLARVRWPADGSTLIDPACGDGVFLEAAVEKAVAAGLAGRRLRAVVADRIVGWDLDADALDACRVRLSKALASAGCTSAMPRLAHRDALETGPEEAFGCVVGNPPYLEAKRMPPGLKSRLRARFPLAARGAFDLYGAFVELAARLGAGGGELCLLIPNRFLVVGYAGALREKLVLAGRVTVEDLSRERVFADAAVYPIVLHARFDEPSSYVVHAAGDRRATSPLVLSGEVVLGSLGGMLPVAPDHPGGRRLLARVLSEVAPLRQQAAVTWTVSFHRAGLRDRYVFAERPDSPHARRFLGGGRFAGNREVEPCRIRWGGAWIDYDEGRARADRNPLPSAALFDADKLVVCQNARRARCAVDRGRFVLKDTLLAVRSAADTAPDTLEWLALVLHSDLFHYLYEHLYGGTRKGGGYLHFLARYLEPFPVPARPADVPVADLYALGGGGGKQAEAAVRAAYGVTAGEAEALDGYGYP